MKTLARLLTPILVCLGSLGMLATTMSLESEAGIGRDAGPITEASTERGTAAVSDTIIFSKTVDPSHVRLGDILTYTLWLSNTGITDASLHLTDTIPIGTEFVSGSLFAHAAEYSPSLPAVLWRGVLVSGTSSQISFQVTTTVDNRIIVNQAQLSDGEQMVAEARASAWVGHALTYFPSILRDWSPRPEVPQLHPIADPGLSRQFTITWRDANRASSYVLQEDTATNFATASEVYTGTGTDVVRELSGIKRYYYRVKARNNWGDSEWSPSESVYVRWEAEPNNSDNPSGPLETGRENYGFQNDLKDFFYFSATTGGAITVDLSSVSGQGTQLQLFYGQPSADNRVAYRVSPPYHIDYVGDPGRYYIYIYTVSGWNESTPYTLQVTFP